MSSPCGFTSAPPLLPGLMAASVWIKASMADWSSMMLMFLPLALMIPAVTVEFRLKGLPMAMTHSPTSTWSEFPMATGCRPSSLIWIRATSVEGSVPTTLAL